jgi:hypothetical protein
MDFRSPTQHDETDDAILDAPYRPFYTLFHSPPILVKQYAFHPIHPSISLTILATYLIAPRANDSERQVFRESPFLGVLLFDNVTSDARDHAANERSTFAHRIQKYVC